MRKFEILLNKNTPEKEFLLKNLLYKEGTLIEEKSYINYDKIIINIPSHIQNEILKNISEILHIFLKFRVLDSQFKNTELTDYDKYALIGALLSIDKEKEVLCILKAISNLKILAIQSLIDFRLNKIFNNWIALGELSYKLSTEICCRNDLYELISYFITGLEQQSRVIITDTLPLNIAIDGNVSPPISLTNNEELNVLLTVVSHAPSHVIIKNQELLSQKLLETFRALGQ